MRLTTVIPYRRVSTKAQAMNGVSFADQEHEQEKFAKVNQFQLAEAFSDVGSGFKEEEGSKRDQYKAACRLSLKNDWAILVTSPSRFTRTIEEYDRFIARGGRVIATSLGLDATEAEFRAALKIEIAEHKQRQRTAARGRERAIAEGRSSAVRDLTLAWEKSIEVRKENALRGYREFERYESMARAEGAKSPRDIAVAFNRMGFKTPTNRRWKQGNVDRVLKAIAELRAATGSPSAAESGSPEYRHVGENSQPKIKARLASLLTNFKHADDQAEPEANCTSATEQSDELALNGAGELNPAGFPLSPDELAELRELMERRNVPAEKLEGFIRAASSPTLTPEARAAFTRWMVQKREELATV